MVVVGVVGVVAPPAVFHASQCCVAFVCYATAPLRVHLMSVTDARLTQGLLLIGTHRLVLDADLCAVAAISHKSGSTCHNRREKYIGNSFRCRHRRGKYIQNLEGTGSRWLSIWIYIYIHLYIYVLFMFLIMLLFMFLFTLLLMLLFMFLCFYFYFYLNLCLYF